MGKNEQTAAGQERAERLKRERDCAEKMSSGSAGYAVTANEAMCEPVPLVDQLKSERIRKVREHSQFLREIDRQIGLLEETNAEETMKRGYELLNRCHTTFI